jgi:hypothetical protein
LPVEVVGETVRLRVWKSLCAGSAERNRVQAF